MMNLIVLVANSFCLGGFMVIWMIDKQERLSMGLYGLVSLIFAVVAALRLLAEMGAL